MVYEVPLTNKKYKLIFTQTKDSICVQLFKKFRFWWGICDVFWFEYKDFTGIEADGKRLLDKVYGMLDRQQVFDYPKSNRGQYVRCVINELKNLMIYE